MRIDAAQVKERISLKELFERDGHEFRRMGSSIVCRCPVHDEKTASCHVHEEERFFRCFGCGWGGDCYVYWQRTRGVEFPEALKALAEMAGLVAGSSNLQAPSSKVIARKPQEPEKLADPLTGKQLETWLAAVDALRSNEAARQRLAEWRGYSRATVQWAVDQGLIGLIPFLGETREAFLVERPLMDGEQARQIGIGFHVRLGPRTPHNDSDKPSWRYVPQGIGAWPFVMGHVRSAKVLFFLEGQWDGLALVDAMAWTSEKSEVGSRKSELPPGVAVIGMRGATSWKRFMAHYQWPEEAVAFALGQADEAGRGWFSEGNLIDALRLRCKRVWAFWPMGGPRGLDFNDLWKKGLVNGDELKASFREKMRRRGKGRRKPGITFFQFCRREKGRADAVGSVARLVLADTRRPRGRKPLRDWERYLTRYVPEEKHPDFYAAWKEWGSRRHEATKSLAAASPSDGGQAPSSNGEAAKECELVEVPA